MAKYVRRVMKAQRVLEYIGMHPQGLSFSQIQKFIVTMNGKDWDEMSEREPTRRRWRGYWCDYLVGVNFYGKNAGILNKFCIRHPVTGRWILTEKIKGPFTTGPKTKTENHNFALSQGKHKVYMDNLPKCPNCKHPVHPSNRGSEWAPDRQAHMSSFASGGADTDCKGRVWHKGRLTSTTSDQFDKVKSSMERALGSWKQGTDATEAWLATQVIG